MCSAPCCMAVFCGCRCVRLWLQACCMVVSAGRRVARSEADGPWPPRPWPPPDAPLVLADESELRLRSSSPGMQPSGRPPPPS